jgi:hypothetical protein
MVLNRDADSAAGLQLNGKSLGGLVMLTIQPPAPSIRAAWSFVWRVASEALLEFVPPEEREALRGATDAQIDPDAPQAWLLQVGDIMSRRVLTVGQLTQVLSKLKTALAAYRDQCFLDPSFFPSRAGQELMRIANQAFVYSNAEYRTLLWPTLRIALQEPAALVLPVVGALQKETPFENWANRLRHSLHQLIERWYRPMLSTFYRLDRIEPGGGLPVEIFEFGNLTTQAREFWGDDNPLSELVDEHITLLRNSEAHGHTEVDVKREVVTFRNRNRRGQVTGEWTASASDLDVLARHISHLGGLMQAVLCVVPLADLELDPAELAAAMIASLGGSAA